ncbi:MAG: NAD(P)-binding protein [Gemmatimonas sp.]|nr:NAD(P)-binding protein [Gemmatimonas sp.]
MPFGLWRPVGEPDWDAIVVGAGPAGSTTARLLGGRGHRVLLLDRAAFPRPKPCGDSINPGAVNELRELGLLDLIRGLPHAPIAGWRVRSERGHAFEAEFPCGTSGIGIDRSDFDAALVSEAVRAGSTLRCGVRVVDLLTTDGDVAGVRGADGEEIPARVVVGADGLRSVVVRKLGLIRRAPRLRKMALTAKVRGREGGGCLGELHLTPWGCVGIADVGRDTANVVAVMSAGAKMLGRGAETRFDLAVSSIPSLTGAIRVSRVLATGPFDWPTRGTTAPGALLVGDAAGYYDPFTGQGIYRALRGARLAAKAVDEALRGDADASFRRYEAAYRRSFAGSRRLQHLIEGVTSRPWLFGSAATAFQRWPILPNRLLEVTGDLAPASHLLSSSTCRH